MRWVSFGIAVASLFALAVHAHSQSPLPKEVQADMLVGKIEAALAAGNAKEALIGLAEYRRLGVKLPPALLFLEGRLAAIAQDYARSKNAITEYLGVLENRNDKNYSAALKLLTDVEKAQQTAEVASFQQARIACARKAPLAAQTLASNPGLTFQDCPLTPEMVVVPGGSFLFGADKETQVWHGLALIPAKAREATRKSALKYHTFDSQIIVSIKTFAIGKFEITIDEWNACVTSGGCDGHQPESSVESGRYPISNISWDDAQSYVNWINKLTSRKYRLLTSSEWEYAAKAGTTTKFSFGDYPTPGVLNQTGKIQPVGSLAPNPFGVHDMHGNVWEWTQDCAYSEQTKTPIDGSAYIDKDCSQRIARGGSYKNIVEVQSSSWSSGHQPNVRDANSQPYGFRVALDLD